MKLINFTLLFDSTGEGVADLYIPRFSGGVADKTLRSFASCRRQGRTRPATLRVPTGTILRGCGPALG